MMICEMRCLPWELSRQRSPGSALGSQQLGASLCAAGRQQSAEIFHQTDEGRHPCTRENTQPMHVQQEGKAVSLSVQAITSRLFVDLSLL